MNRVQILLAILFAFGVTAHARAADSGEPPPLGKHQLMLLMNDCMKKRMWADQKISYHDAEQWCRDRLRQRGAGGPSDPLVASGNLSKR